LLGFSGFSMGNFGRVVLMALKQFLALTLALIPASGHAECETEAIKARQMIMASGPFEYSGKLIRQSGPSEQQRGFAWGYVGEYIDQGNGQPEQQLSGLIEPLRAHHILNKHRAFYVTGLSVREEIAIGEQIWLRSDTGWFQPITLHQPQQALISWQELSRYYIVSAKCLGPIEVEGKSLIGYELQYGTIRSFMANRTLREQVFAEPGTGLTVRLEQIYPDEHGVLTFHYDAAIKIEPPKVEANAPEVPVFHFGAATKF
jgi:hypothetical protein